jgi:hypothetical protein
VLNASTLIASCNNFALVGSDVIGTLDLTSSAVTGLFAATDQADATRELYLILWDSTLKALRVAWVISIQNSIDETALTAPTPV